MPKRSTGEPLMHTCHVCGREEDLAVFSETDPLFRKMRDEELCYDCAHWNETAEKPDPQAVAISGALYRIKIEKNRRRWLIALHRPGCLCILDPKSKKAHVLSWLFRKGAIPERLRKRIPNDYYFITVDEYRRICRRRTKTCLSKGCLDRYRCLWYDRRSAEPKGAWNRVFNFHKPGIEKCPSFVNIEQIKTNEYPHLH